jgi:hypothetical protein
LTITSSIDRAARRVEHGWTNVGHGYPGLTMMGRRLLLLVAVLMGLTALAASIAPRDTGSDEPATPPGRPGTVVEPSATPQLAPAAPAPEEEDVVEETLSAAKGASPVRVRARPGQTVKLQVQGRVFDEVELTGLDRVEAIAPEAPARFEIYLDQPGRFEIRLLEADRRLGELLVRE